MKKITSKKSDPAKGMKKAKGGRKEVPLEFDRAWQELEDQHERIKSDWMSLAAQVGLGSKSKGL